MLQQQRIGVGNSALDQLTPNFTGLGDEKRIYADARRATAARYFIFFVGVAMLSWVLAHAFGLGGALSISHSLRVALVAVMGPVVVWFASDRELGLLREIDKRNKQLQQRVREITALNRMTQDHLAECFSFTQAEQQYVEAAAD